MAVTRVALLGLGRMGAPMAAHLIRAGHATRVGNRSAAGYRRLADEQATLDVSAVAERATTPADAVKPGTVVCDLGTIGVAAAQAHAAELATLGMSFVDAPVSGGVAGVRSKSLLVMAGGEPAAVARGTPVLESFAARVLRGRRRGCRQAMKLAVHPVPHTLNAALGESLVLAERGGVARRTALAGRSPMPLVEVVRGLADRASLAGRGQRDMSTIAELHRRR